MANERMLIGVELIKIKKALISQKDRFVGYFEDLHRVDDVNYHDHLFLIIDLYKHLISLFEYINEDFIIDNNLYGELTNLSTSSWNLNIEYEIFFNQDYIVKNEVRASTEDSATLVRIENLLVNTINKWAEIKSDASKNKTMNEFHDFKKESNKSEVFSELVFELLNKLGKVRVVRDAKYYELGDHESNIDILMGEPKNINDPLTAVEVKYYRPYSRPSSEVVQRAIGSVQHHLSHSNVTHGLLVISCTLHPYDHELFIENSKIEIWDLDTVISKAEGFPEILEKIYNILELDKNVTTLELKKLLSKNRLEGENLLLDLKSIPSGRPGAYAFESWCIKVLKYLFGEYLTGWHEQSETVDGLNRRDLVCRVRRNSEAEIWELILDTLKSRYVVFEFKNYTDELSQREIITTERYLYPTALRNCGFILSREGVSKNANSVIAGAMREHGKLIISLDYNDISKMLKGKDDGDDPNVYLFEKVDEFLIGLGR
ncbi:restriction endonuclease [Acinetobacter baumannii]|nr:hypothetical protein [Acinetobacter baumannii]